MKHGLRLVVVGCLLALPYAGRSQVSRGAQKLEPKPYRIGIAPPHVTTSPDPIFELGAPWGEVRKGIDFYKFHADQLDPPQWVTPLSVEKLAGFSIRNRKDLGSEFGSFGFSGGDREGLRAAKRAIELHAGLVDRGARLRSLHLDGPIRRMLKGAHRGECQLPLHQVAQEIQQFFRFVHKAFPRLAIGLVVDLPDWDYTEELVGFDGGYSEDSGVTYVQALEAVHMSLASAGEKMAFIEVKCPFNYYRSNRTRAGDAEVSNRKKLKAIHRWCSARNIDFHLVVNFDYLEPELHQEDRDRRFQEETLNYIRALRRDGIFPEAFIIQSDEATPARHLPDSTAHTFMQTAEEGMFLIRSLYPRSARLPKR